MNQMTLFPITDIKVPKRVLKRMSVSEISTTPRIGFLWLSATGNLKHGMHFDHIKYMIDSTGWMHTFSDDAAETPGPAYAPTRLLTILATEED